MISKRCFFVVIFVIQTCFGIISLHSSCLLKNNPDNLEISLFEFACRVDTLRANGKTYFYKTDAYLVSGYKNTSSHEVTLDSFVCKVKDTALSDFGEYFILFYKKSKFTNNEYISKNPRDLDRYSQDNDLLYQYKWRESKFLSKSIYKGKLHSDSLICN